MRKFFNKLINIKILAIPILFYFGERSYIAQDEGYYALQAKWILESGKWLAPVWWNDISFDRTVSIQWAIAISQKLFGENIFFAHLPSLISGIICLYFTYKLSEELTGYDRIWLSPGILMTTYIWINNLHLAGQDMPLLALEMIGIYTLIKYEKTKKEYYAFLSGLIIGPALFIKTTMIIIPILCITPYILISNRKILTSRNLYLGFIIGLLPLILWISASVKEYGFEDVYGILEKIKYLSNSNDFSKSPFYYIWNVPVNTLPWSLASIYGMIQIHKSGNIRNKFILIVYPVLLIMLLSLFKTKTSFYPLQISPFLAISAAEGIRNLSSLKEKYLSIIRKLFLIVSILLMLILIYININKLIDINNILLFNLSILLISISFLITSYNKNRNYMPALLFIGPYLAFVLFVQSGQFCNRDIETKDILTGKAIFSKILDNDQLLYYNSKLNNDEFSKLVKIGLYAPNNVNRINELSRVQKNELVWLNLEENNSYLNQFTIIYTHKKLSPWFLGLKN